MEKINGIGFICKIEPHGNTSCIITLFSKENGTIVGHFKGGLSKYKQHICKIGNLVEFTWIARTTTHLGHLELLPLQSFFSSKIFQSSIINTTCEMLQTFMHKNDAHPNIFQEITTLFLSLQKTECKNTIIFLYAIFENHLLRELGLGNKITLQNANNISETKKILEIHLNFLKSHLEASMLPVRNFTIKLF